MAEHIHKTYTCDRCKTDLGSVKPHYLHNCEIVATFNYRDSPGPRHVWRDLCTKCYEEVIEFFKVL